MMRSTIRTPVFRALKPHPSPRLTRFSTSTSTSSVTRTTTIATAINPLRHHAAPYSSSSTTTPFNPDTFLQSARQKFASQPPTLIPDVLSPTHSHLLTLSLADHVPALFPADQLSKTLPSPSPSSSSSTHPQKQEQDDNDGDGDLSLPQGHHLVYFPLQLPPSKLMPDGTDPAHWPGAPFVRRMWAGGEVVFRDGWERDMRMDGRGVVCEESVGEPVMKEGKGEGEEKVFVEVKRLYGVGDGRRGFASPKGPVVEEVRRLVFMRSREGGVVKGVERGRVVRAPATPEFTFTLKPDATLLFHFSALTYNAHSIHLDSDYCRNREGYKGLLVHGPLSLVLMLSALRASLRKVLALTPSGSKGAAGEGHAMPYVKSLNYRNLAPLYVGEEMKVCVRRGKVEGDELGWDVWIEGPEGGLAVKGRAVTTGVAQTA